MGYQGLDEILMITLISSKKVGVCRYMKKHCIYLGIYYKIIWLFNWEHEFGPNYVFASNKEKNKNSSTKVKNK